MIAISPKRHIKKLVKIRDALALWEGKNESDLFKTNSMGDIVCITSALLDIESTIHYLRCLGNPKSEVHKSVEKRERDRKEEADQKQRWKNHQLELEARAKAAGLIASDQSVLDD